jgi:hypothetical protein
MAHRAPRKTVSLSHFGICKIRIEDHPSLPGRNLYGCEPGSFDTRAPVEEVRAQFAQLTAQLHHHQEMHDRSWLAGMVRYLYVSDDQQRREDTDLGIAQHIADRRAKKSLDEYERATLKLWERQQRWSARGHRPSATEIHRELSKMFGSAYTETFSEHHVRRALTAARKYDSRLAGERPALRKSTP